MNKGVADWSILRSGFLFVTFFCNPIEIHIIFDQEKACPRQQTMLFQIVETIV